MAPTSVFLLGKFHGPRSLEGYICGGHKQPGMAEQLSMHAYGIPTFLAFMDFFCSFFHGVENENKEIVHSQTLSFDLGFNFSGSLQNSLHIKIPFTIYHPSLINIDFFKKLKHLDIT